MQFENAVIKSEISYEKALKKLAGGVTSEKEAIPLTTQYIELIHNEMISSFGGCDGIRDNNLLLSVTDAPYQSFGGCDLYPTLFDKAAKYLVDFSRYQIFLDGNKRTGLAVASTFLLTNGRTLGLSDDEAYSLVMDIANGKVTEVSVVSRMIEEKSQELSEHDKER